MKSILAIIAALWCLSASAAPTNFVLLVECSPRMSVRKETIIDITRELIATGVDERVRPGQIFEVWFYDETIQADAVKMEWAPSTAQQYANYTVERINAKRFNINSDLSKAFPSIQTLLKNSCELTAFILLDGFQPLTGTPFDEQINRAMSANRDAFFAAKEPFLITLLGRDGKWIAGTVHSKLGATIDIPEFPKPVVAEKVTAPVKVAEAAPPPKALVQAPPPKRPESEPVVERKPEPVVAKPTPPPVVAETKIETPASIPKPQTSPGVAILETKVAEEPPSTAPETAPEPAVQAVATPPANPPKFPWPILLAIFGLIAAGGIYAYSRMKDAPRPPPASLISQVYDSSRDETIPRLPGSPGMRIKIRLPPANPPVQEEGAKRQERSDENQG